MVGYTELLAEQTHSWQPEDRAAARDLAERAVLDTIAVGLAAVGDPTVTTAVAALGQGAGGGASVLPTGATADPRHASLLGGLTSHALDYDDVDDAMIGHPSTVLVPALLAVAEDLDLSGESVTDAYGLGLLACRDLASRLGITGHYRQGWHSTSTIGTVAATAALARLRRLDPTPTRNALGIAGSLAGGSRQNFGTMTKPLHAGVAASNAVLATDLAASGFTADPDQLEGPLGFLALHHADADAHPEPVQSPDAAGLNVKLHPCCYYIHCAADAVLELVALGLRAEEVERVLVSVQPGGLAPLIHARPTTGLQGKFSLEYSLAAALLDHRLTLRGFTDAEVRRPAAQALLRRVEKIEAPDPPVGGPADGWYSVVQVWTRTGEVLARRVDRPRGHATRPVTDDELQAKVTDCLRYAGLDQAAGAFACAGLRALGTAPSVRSVLAPLRDLVTERRLAGVVS